MKEPIRVPVIEAGGGSVKSMADGAHQEKPISLFYSYSHRDEAFRGELEAHLSFLRRSKLIAEWHDRRIDAGQEWKGQIDRQLAEADIILLLVSADFIASDYCWGEEMTKALERHQRGETKVIPVILRPCQWQKTLLASLQAVPKDGKPVTEWPNQDAAFDNVVDAICRTIAALQQERRSMAEEARKPQVAEAVFRDIDAPWCPEMVELLVENEFIMGSPENEEERHYCHEGPRRFVRIGSMIMVGGFCTLVYSEPEFQRDSPAVGRYPVTFAEYDYFCEVTDREKPDDNGWGRGRRPVINVSWRDARAYCAWLANETGQPYRLPSEAEWEYAARAGTTTRYAFGDAITPKDANYGSNIGKTTEVGAYRPNAWGLHDMHGNVNEWVEDIWHDSYKGAPAYDTAWTDGVGQDSGRYRVTRGGSWRDPSSFLRSAFRNETLPGDRNDNLGFRVARTLTCRIMGQWLGGG